VSRTTEQVKNVHLVNRPTNTLNTEMYIWCIKLISKSLMFTIINYMNYMN